MGIHVNDVRKALDLLELLQVMKSMDGDGQSAPQPAAPPSTPSTPAPRVQTSGQSGSVSIDQTKLLQLVNMTRRFVRYSREGNIPSKEQRKYARRSIKAVKHLLPQSDPAQLVGR